MDPVERDRVVDLIRRERNKPVQWPRRPVVAASQAIIDNAPAAVSNQITPMADMGPIPEATHNVPPTKTPAVSPVSTPDTVPDLVQDCSLDSLFEDIIPALQGDQPDTAPGTPVGAYLDRPKDTVAEGFATANTRWPAFGLPPSRQDVQPTTVMSNDSPAEAVGGPHDHQGMPWVWDYAVLQPVVDPNAGQSPPPASFSNAGPWTS